MVYQPGAEPKMLARVMSWANDIVPVITRRQDGCEKRTDPVYRLILHNGEPPGSCAGHFDSTRYVEPPQRCAICFEDVEGDAGSRSSNGQRWGRMLCCRTVFHSGRLADSVQSKHGDTITAPAVPTVDEEGKERFYPVELENKHKCPVCREPMKTSRVLEFD